MYLAVRPAEESETTLSVNQFRSVNQNAAVSLKRSLLSAIAVVSVKAGSTNATAIRAQIAAMRAKRVRLSAISVALHRVGRWVGIQASR
jgi:hypothetical protein